MNWIFQKPNTSAFAQTASTHSYLINRLFRAKALSAGKGRKPMPLKVQNIALPLFQLNHWKQKKAQSAAQNAAVSTSCLVQFQIDSANALLDLPKIQNKLSRFVLYHEKCSRQNSLNFEFYLISKKLSLSGVIRQSRVRNKLNLQNKPYLANRCKFSQAKTCLVFH